MDNALKDGRPIGELVIGVKAWEDTRLHSFLFSCATKCVITLDYIQDALLEYRSRCHDLGLTIRPRVFEELEEQELPIMDMSNSPSPASSPGESSKVTATDIKYLKSQGGIKGVLEIHKARVALSSL